MAKKYFFLAIKRYLTQLVIIFGFFLFYFYFCVFTRVQLEFNSFLTNDPRPAKIADDPSTSCGIGLVYPVVVHTRSITLLLQPAQFLITQSSMHSTVVPSMSVPFTAYSTGLYPWHCETISFYLPLWPSR